MASSSSAGSSSSRASSGQPIDPIARNALRYSLSAREYQLLHRYLISRSPAAQKKAPAPAKFERQVTGEDDYNAAAIRAALRVWVGTYVGMKSWDAISAKLFAKGQEVQKKAQTGFFGSDNARLASSMSLILLFHRLLHRFLLRLRESLKSDQAKPFRQRNPAVSAALTAKLTPAIGAAMAGLFLGVTPSSQLRLSITIYVFSRSLEFFYNNLEDLGYFKNRPWWFGSWLIMPAALGQLLHAFVFDRECFPASFGKFIMGHSDTYIKAKPETYTGKTPWPGTYTIVDSLAQMSLLKWPAFVSPILFPNKNPLPKTVLAVSPIMAAANPSIKHLSCALLHPDDTSCLRTYITFYIRAFPTIARFFTVLLSAYSVLRYQTFLKEPIPAFNKLAKSILRMSLFVTGAIGTSWGSICFFQNYLPKGMLPTKRWFLGGFIGGLWAFLERGTGRSNFLYSARLSMDSVWKVGKKHGWWKGFKNGDVLLFTASLALIQAIYEADPKAINGGAIRKSLGVLRGEGWVDRAVRPHLSESESRVLAEREIKQESHPMDEEDSNIVEKQQKKIN